MGKKEKEEVEAAIYSTLKKKKSSYSWIKGAVETQEKGKVITCDQRSDHLDTPMVIPSDQGSGQMDTPYDQNRHTQNTRYDMVTRSDLRTYRMTISSLENLSPQQQKIYRYLASIRDARDPSKTVPVGYGRISEKTGVPRATVRKVIHALERYGVIANFQTIKKLHLQGTIYLIKKNLDIGSDLRSHCVTKTMTSLDTPMDTISSSIIDINTTTSSDQGYDHLLAEKLILEDWPQLNPQSLKPFVEEGKFTIEDLQEHLDIAHYNIEKMKNTEKPVRDRYSFLFSTLRKGYITPLEGYKSRTEMALEKRLQLKKQKIERIKALRKELLQAEFEEFYYGLSEEELAEIKKKAEEKYNPQGLISKELQVKLALNEILRKRFAEKGGYSKELNVEIKEDV